MKAQFRNTCRAFRTAVLLGILGILLAPTMRQASAQVNSDDPCNGGVPEQVITARAFSGVVISWITYPPLPGNLQLAINFAEAGTLGGEVTIPGGTFSLTAPLVIHTGKITIRGNGRIGSGMSPTILRRPGGPLVFTGQGSKLKVKNMSIESPIGPAVDLAPMVQGEFYCLSVVAGTRGIGLSSSQGTASSENWVHNSTITTLSAQFGGIEIGGNNNRVELITFVTPGRAVELTGNLNLVMNSTVTGSTSDVIKVVGVSNSVQNNTITGSGSSDAAIRVISNGSGVATVTFNTLKDVSTGIAIQGDGGADVRLNTISKCDSGIRLQGGDNVLVGHNTISKCSNAGIWVTSGDDHEISDNDLTHPGAQGILLENSDSDTIARNTIWNPSREGIWTRNSSDGHTIEENEIQLSDHEGILIDNGNNSAIHSNVLFCNNRAFDPNHLSSIAIVTGTGNVIDLNTISHWVNFPSITVPMENTVANNTESVCIP
ncbi:MAG: right-handed parallel beta-helix repeat-containing protein [Ardenticatenia bacterium]|nr:right-handed parallel beta-helix repeat-containing protein [Ardenticatenia bacterium]